MPMLAFAERAFRLRSQSRPTESSAEYGHRSPRAYRCAQDGTFFGALDNGSHETLVLWTCSIEQSVPKLSSPQERVCGTAFGRSSKLSSCCGASKRTVEAFRIAISEITTRLWELFAYSAILLAFKYDAERHTADGRPHIEDQVWTVGSTSREYDTTYAQLRSRNMQIKYSSSAIWFLETGVFRSRVVATICRGQSEPSLHFPCCQGMSWNPRPFSIIARRPLARLATPVRRPLM
jgi:hypothetical protein